MAGQRTDVGKTKFDKNPVMRAVLYAFAKKRRFEFTYQEAAAELQKAGFDTSHGSIFAEINTKGRGWPKIKKPPKKMPPKHLWKKNE